MAEKKKFEKPQMEVIKVDTKVGVMTSSSCPIDGCGSPGSTDCLTYSE